MSWRVEDVPDLTGRTAIVTGPSTGGLGWYTARELARRGAHVVLAGRSPEKLGEAAGAVKQEVPEAELDQLVVDVSDLASVRRAAESAARFGPLHLLVNNAGVMGTKRSVTADGLDLQMATNHFGPFLLTGLLLPQLIESGSARVVSVASQMHRIAGRAPLGDPTAQPRLYRKWRTYGQSKLANLLFAAELDRRCREAGVPVAAYAAHPGFAATHLAANGQYGRSSGGIAGLLDRVIGGVAQSAEAGAWPTLMAATADLPPGSYVGPDGPGEFLGRPAVTTGSKLARDPRSAQRLWEISEGVTGISYP